MKAYSQALQPAKGVSRTYTARSGRIYHVTEHPVNYCQNSRRSLDNRARLSVRAIEVSGPQGSTPSPPVSPDQQRISAELVDSMREKIREALQADKVDISDTYGDGRHVSIDVVSKAFEGESSMKRQRMVYRAIWLELQDTVHAVDAMTTKTPEEAGLT